MEITGLHLNNAALVNHFLSITALLAEFLTILSSLPSYAEDLRLTSAFLSPKFDVPADCSAELSPLGYQFLTDIFETFDKVCIPVLLVLLFHLPFPFPAYLTVFQKKAHEPLLIVCAFQDRDGALCPAELEELFSTSPGNPWASQRFPDTTVSDDAGAVTLQGWLAQWR